MLGSRWSIVNLANALLTLNNDAIRFYAFLRATKTFSQVPTRKSKRLDKVLFEYNFRQSPLNFELFNSFLIIHHSSLVVIKYKQRSFISIDLDFKNNSNKIPEKKDNGKGLKS